MKCQNCYAQIKSGSNICDYCGTQIISQNKSSKKENFNNNISVSPEYDEERLTPEFRQILGYNPNQKRSSESDEINYQGKQYLENLYTEKKAYRKWGITQTIIEFIIYCIIINLLEGYYEQQDVVVAIYLIWSFIRAFNLFVIKRFS